MGVRKLSSSCAASLDPMRALKSPKSTNKSLSGVLLKTLLSSSLNLSFSSLLAALGTGYYMNLERGRMQYRSSVIMCKTQDGLEMPKT